MALLAPVAVSAKSARPEDQNALDFGDPVVRSKVRAKVIGSTIDQTIFNFYRLHVYAYLHSGNVIPLFSMNNLNVTVWTPVSAIEYAVKSYEAGVYTTFDDVTLLEYWDNPVTGERRKVWQFIGGPIDVAIGPDGVNVSGDATLRPKSMAFEMIGDTLFIPTQSSFFFPNLFQPQEWPKESSGETFYWDSFFTFTAKLSDILDDSSPSVASTAQFQNLVSWHPWLGMGQLPGRTFGRAAGVKLFSLDDVPMSALRLFERFTPQILDVSSWGKKRNDLEDYLRERRN